MVVPGGANNTVHLTPGMGGKRLLEVVTAYYGDIMEHFTKINDLNQHRDKGMDK